MIEFEIDTEAHEPTAEIQPIKSVPTGRNYRGQLNGCMTRSLPPFLLSATFGIHSRKWLLDAQQSRVFMGLGGT
jgi:hypothetical protein